MKRERQIYYFAHVKKAAFKDELNKLGNLIVTPEHIQSSKHPNVVIAPTSKLEQAINLPGRLMTKVILGDSNLSVRGPKYIDEKTHESIREVLGKMPHTKDTKVYVGNSPIIDQMKRTWQGKGTSFNQPVIRHLMTPISGLAGLSQKLSGGDYYNPLANTAIVRSNIPAVAAHELGHSEDFNKRKYPTLYNMAGMVNIPGTPATLYQEYQASANAAKHMEVGKETLPILTPAYGSYVGGAAGSLYSALKASKGARGPKLLLNPIAGALIGQVLSKSPAFQFKKGDKPKDEG